jgi:hypothetical protein
MLPLCDGVEDEPLEHETTMAATKKIRELRFASSDTWHLPRTIAVVTARRDRARREESFNLRSARDRVNETNAYDDA